MDDHTPDHKAEGSSTFFSNKLYDILKFVSLVLLPATATAYFALSGLWGLPYTDEVVGTIVVVDTFLGAILGFSTSQYNKSDARFDGEIVVTPNEEGNSDLNLSLDSQAVANKKAIVVKVDRQ